MAEPTPNRPCTSAAGVDRADGDRARPYLGQHYGLTGGDFHRVERQQQRIRSVLGRLVTADTFTDPAELDGALHAVTDAVAVSDSLCNTTVLDLACSLRGVGTEDVQHYTAPVLGSAWRARPVSSTWTVRPRSGCGHACAPTRSARTRPSSPTRRSAPRPGDDARTSFVKPACSTADGGLMLITWLVVGLVVWTAAALLMAAVIGGGIRMADRRSSPIAPDGALAGTPSTHSLRIEPAMADRRAARIPVGLTGLGAALAGIAVLLQVSAYVAEQRGLSGTAGRVLSMDGPEALSRVYVTGLFAVAAVVAVIGAGRSRARRAWWAAVSAVAAATAVVKGGVVHQAVLGDLAEVVTFPYAVLASVLAAAAAVGGLWWLSRHERRDRTRVLGTLAMYAGASVVLSAGSSVVHQASGRGTWLMTATFLEESVEGLAAVAFLMAVLVGVAPRLVLPAEWTMRRATDEAGLGASALPGFPAAGPSGETSS